MTQDGVKAGRAASPLSKLDAAVADSQNLRRKSQKCEVMPCKPSPIPRHKQGSLVRAIPSWTAIPTYREFRNGPSFAGCFMSPLCGDARDSCGFHISSPHRGTVPSRAAS